MPTLEGLGRSPKFSGRLQCTQSRPHRPVRLGGFDGPGQLVGAPGPIMGFDVKFQLKTTPQPDTTTHSAELFIKTFSVKPMMGRSIHETTRRSPHDISTVSDESTPAGRVAALSEQKRQIETELHQQYDVLSVNSIDLTSPLTDVNGFPRDDVPDLASVRVARARVCELKNDHRAIVDQLAQTLPLLLPKEDHSSATPIKGASTNGSSSSSMVPFAQIDVVAPDSPAEQAGLKLHDQIVRFGHLNAQNHDRLQALAKLVAESEDQNITVVCFRFEEGNKTMISKELKPHSGWGGRGLLGLSGFLLFPVMFTPTVMRHS
ncbi:putative 26S proteasome regulatory subunit [Puccinia graminis f. sp. tritici]|uniref:Probable 26S proteasome regulatory subunit p27 n=1 Tax=Puccinia graminis f. sp. tritici TaxID=56615 RepID=A0A5B0MYN0_PUCGR|nr:putative 26S proteasome regulatory subunit [Puccinia graminis f. sp. tritici]